MNRDGDHRHPIMRKICKFTGAHWIALKLLGPSNAQDESEGVLVVQMVALFYLWVNWIGPTYFF